MAAEHFSEEEGEEIVKLARRAVEQYLFHSIYTKADSEKFSKMRGVFVTLNYFSSRKEEHLRGCIGFPYPEKKLGQAIVEVAIAAATQDPRFPPVKKEDLESITFEVSVITLPVEIAVKDYAYINREVKIGRDGLILKSNYGSGLLLPQVPVELNWDIDEYLENLCYKAGVTPDSWVLPTSKLYKFEASIFKESVPNGKIARMSLGKS